MFDGVVDFDVALSQGRTSVSSQGSSRSSRSTVEAAVRTACEEEMQKYREEIQQLKANQENMQRLLQVKYLNVN